MEIIPSNYVEVSDIEQIKKCLVYMMGEFHKICEDNHLIYNVFGGTMLGAVRHKGMIPWDDDIDVTMPRNDYNRLKKVVAEKYFASFRVQAFPDKNHAYPFAKFILNDSILNELMKKKYKTSGLYIDVFPVDGYPDPVVEKDYFKKLRVYKRLRCYALVKLSPECGLVNNIRLCARAVRSELCALPGVQFYLRKEVSLGEKYDYDSSEYVLLQGAGWNEKGKLKKSVYLNRKLYDFDGIKVWGIADYDEHLTRLYGDYMTMPPEEKRVSNHTYKLYIDGDILEKIPDGGNEE